MSLVDLASTPLLPADEKLLASAVQGAAGPKAWRLRMQREARDLLALARRAPRMTVLDLEMPGDLHAVIRVAMPVPCRIGDGDLVIAHEAVLGLNYPEESLTRALPGWAFVQVLQPRGVFLPTVKMDPQLVCLGTKIPPGTKLVELILMSYRSAVLQEHMLDERSPGGVFRADAAQWWQRNLHRIRIPLTDAPFLADDPAAADERGGTP